MDFPNRKYEIIFKKQHKILMIFDKASIDKKNFI